MRWVDVNYIQDNRRIDFHIYPSFLSLIRRVHQLFVLISASLNSREQLVGAFEADGEQQGGDAWSGVAPADQGVERDEEGALRLLQFIVGCSING